MSESRLLYSSDAVRAIDAAAIARGTPALELMERAGRASWQLLRQRWPAARRLLVCCGPGNNGGDGYVVARLAALAGCTVRVVALPVDAARVPTAATVRERWRSIGSIEQLATDTALGAPDLIIDALFGIGISRPVEGVAEGLIAAINAHPAPVLALDVPSGVDADLGSCPGAAVDADCTLSFIAAKRGLATGRGRALAGERHLAALDVLAQEDDPAADAALIDPQLARQLLRPRPDDAHKGDHGHVLVAGGDHGMAGAARLCAEAALRCGAGLVSVLTRPEHVSGLLAARPECMARGWDPATADALLQRADVIAIGPGLGRGEWGQAIWQRLIGSALPKVLDADALNLLAESSQALHAAVITPHPGEAARLLGCATAEIQRDRFGSARALAARFSAVVVLKGNGSLVAEPGGRVEVVDAGNPALAVGGSGDVLTGVIAALLAQGLSGWDAARLGALLHAQAGDRVAEEGARGALASDLFGPLRRLVNP